MKDQATSALSVGPDLQSGVERYLRRPTLSVKRFGISNSGGEFVLNFKNWILRRQQCFRTFAFQQFATRSTEQSNMDESG